MFKKLVFAAMLALCCAPAALAQVSISNLPAAGTVTGSNLTAIVQGGVTKKATITQILAGAAPITTGTAILHGNGTGGFANVTVGSGLSFVGGTLSATGGGGAVSSVFGRSGAVAAATNDYTFAQIGSKPTTLSGYGIVDGVSLSGSQVLTNKTISGSANTLTNIANASLVNSSVTVNGATCTLGGSCIASGISVTPASANIAVTPNPGVGSFTVGTTNIVTYITANRPLLSGDAGTTLIYTCASTCGSTIPAAGTAGFTAGWSTVVFNQGPGTVLLTPDSPSLINGASSLTLLPNTGAVIDNDGTNYPVDSCTACLSGSFGVSSFNTRTGAISPTTGDYTVSMVTGAAPLANPTFTGTVTLPAGTSLTTPDIGVATGTSLVLTGSLTAGAAAVVNWTGESKISSPADGTILACNNACSGFTRLLFGGATASFPSLVVSGAALVVRLGDNSGNAGLTTGALSASGAVTLSGLTTGSGGVALCLSAANLVYKAPC